MRNHSVMAMALVASGMNATAWGGGVPTSVLDEVIVTGRLNSLQGSPLSASEGIVTDEQLDSRPVLRAGELLEVVPGLIVTQHSGDGKANQYFMRGFNLDHGTDLATSVEGVPVNMPSHAHGQGYTDINFLIPELVKSIEYRKGTYYAESGHFAAAGAVNVSYRDTLDKPFVVLEGGQYDYGRAVAAAAPQIGAGTLLFAMDYSRTDGPWQQEENYHKRNALVRYTQVREDSTFHVTAQGYDGEWDSTDQIPLRAVQSGLIDRYDAIDPTSGGSSHRYSLSTDWRGKLASGDAGLLLYALDYDLDLFSNFSYFTDQENGDQFEQLDDRRVYGGEGSWGKSLEWWGLQHAFATGVQVRRDDIDAVGLYRTRARQRIGTIREDSIQQTTSAVYGSVETSWTRAVRTSFALRADHIDFDVDAALPANSGRRSDSILSPKLSIVLGPWSKSEVFVNVGKGFHANDARGTTITVDPQDGTTPVGQVSPLVSALGYDVGFRSAVLPNTQISMSLWTLRLDSEILFVGDAGITEASRASERRGIELSAIWNPLQWLIVDADLALSRARFTESDPAGDRIPGAVDHVVSLGLAVNHPRGWFGGARLRHFGAAPLIEDDSVRSTPTTLVNVEVGYRFSERYKLSAALYNVFDSKDNDIAYFYESQLAGEPEPVEDIHFHPVEPRAVRVTLTASF